jgi:hypothetical protein
VERYTIKLDSVWARHSWLLSVVIVLVVSGLGFALDLLLIREGLPRKDMMLFSNVLTGLIAGWLFHSFAQHERMRREIVRARMHTVAELNHHIRNALQVIKFWGGSQSNVDSMQLQLINDAVDRIEWALREVLEKYPSAPLTASAPESSPSNSSSKPEDELLRQRKHSNPNRSLPPV